MTSGGVREVGENVMIMRVVTCVALCLCAVVSGCTVYSLRSSDNAQVIAMRESDNKLRAAQLEQSVKIVCVKTGGSWVPIKQTTVADGSNSEANMSCIRGPVDLRALAVNTTTTEQTPEEKAK
jgi:hypothetical protein